MGLDLTPDLLRCNDMLRALDRSSYLCYSMFMTKGETLTTTQRLNHIEEIELIRDYRSDNKKISKRALDRLVLANTGLVHKLTNKFPIKTATCSYEDLYQEGIAGLIHGISKFDVTKGYRLSTYCYNWINAYIRRYFMNHSRSVRVPVHVADAQLSMNKKVEELTQELGHSPSISEISAVIPEAVSILRKTANNVSLNQNIGDESELNDVIGEDKTEEFEYTVDCDILLSKLSSVVSPRDITILQMRYGLNGYNESTLEEIAVQHDLTRARIHQVINQTLSKARALV